MAFPEGIQRQSVALFDQNGQPVTVIGGRVSTDAGVLPVAAIPSDVIRTRIASNLAVDGSSTAQVFTFNADASKDIAICEIRFVIVNDDLKIEGKKFGKGNTLTNGLLVQITAGGVLTELANLTINENFFELSSPGGILFNNQGKKDILSAGIFLAGVGILQAGTGDNITITVRDDLTDRKFKHFTATITGARL